MFRSIHQKGGDERKRGDDDHRKTVKEKFKIGKRSTEKKEKKPKAEGRESFPEKAIRRVSKLFSRPSDGQTASKSKGSDVHRIVALYEEDEIEDVPASKPYLPPRRADVRKILVFEEDEQEDVPASKPNVPPRRADVRKILALFEEDEIEDVPVDLPHTPKPKLKRLRRGDALKKRVATPGIKGAKKSGNVPLFDEDGERVYEDTALSCISVPPIPPPLPSRLPQIPWAASRTIESMKGKPPIIMNEAWRKKMRRAYSSSESNAEDSSSHRVYHSPSVKKGSKSRSSQARLSPPIPPPLPSRLPQIPWATSRTIDIMRGQPPIIMNEAWRKKMRRAHSSSESNSEDSPCHPVHQSPSRCSQECLSPAIRTIPPGRHPQIIMNKAWRKKMRKAYSSSESNSEASSSHRKYHSPPGMKRSRSRTESRDPDCGSPFVLHMPESMRRPRKPSEDAVSEDEDEYLNYLRQREHDDIIRMVASISKENN